MSIQPSWQQELRDQVANRAVKPFHKYIPDQYPKTPSGVQNYLKRTVEWSTGVLNQEENCSFGQISLEPENVLALYNFAMLARVRKVASAKLAIECILAQAQADPYIRSKIKIEDGVSNTQQRIELLRKWIQNPALVVPPCHMIPNTTVLKKEPLC